MPALPIVERELRVTARKGETYWSRSAVVLGLGLLWIPGWLKTFGTTTALNTFVFNGMLWAAFGVSCLSCLFTADAISRERREGTLGLLFLSRVRVGDILLGKLGSSGLKGLSMLAAFLPMLMIPVLVGGVSVGEAAREGLLLLNTFWFSLCVGLYASSRSSESFKAIRTACLLIGALVFTPYVVSFSAGILFKFSEPTWMYIGLVSTGLLSPLSAIGYARDSFVSPEIFWISLAIVQGVAWLFLLFTGLILRRSLGEPQRFRSDSLDPAILVKPRKRFLPDHTNPVAWLVQHQRGIRTTLWLAAGIEVLYFASSWAVLRGMISWNWPSVMPWVVWFFASASTDAMFARAGSSFFYDSKRSGHLEMLVTTPLGPRGVIDGQWSALKKLLAWPVAIALTAMLLDEDISLVTQIGQPGGYSASWITQCFITWGIDIAGSVLGVLAVCWFGMLFALKGRSAAGIVVRAAGLGTAIPAVFKTLYALGAERITFTVPAGGLWPSTITEWLEEIIVMFYYLWLFRVARKAVLRELSGAATRCKKPDESQFTHHFAPHATRATDATI